MLTCATHADQLDGPDYRDVGPVDEAAAAELADRRERWQAALEKRWRLPTGRGHQRDWLTARSSSQRPSFASGSAPDVSGVGPGIDDRDAMYRLRQRRISLGFLPSAVRRAT